MRLLPSEQNVLSELEFVYTAVNEKQRARKHVSGKGRSMACAGQCVAEYAGCAPALDYKNVRDCKKSFDERKPELKAFVLAR